LSHPLLSDFHVTPKFSLNAKIYEPAQGGSQIGIFVTLGMSYEIEASLLDLQKAGIDLAGTPLLLSTMSSIERAPKALSMRGPA
jgi:hypothetical protein